MPHEDERMTLAACVRGDVPSLTPRRWDALGRLAVDERVAGLLERRLEGDDRVPEPVRRRLRAELYNTAAFNLLLYRELARFLSRRPALLSRPVLLKGAALASSLYEDIALRPMSDIDLLVPREELDAWLEIGEAMGYRRASPEMSPGLTDAAHYQVALLGGPGNEVMVELHWSLVGAEADWRSPEMSWFREQTEPWHGPSELEVPDTLQPTATAHLLYLAAHAMLQHGGTQAPLVWFHDIHRLVTDRGARIDWSLALDRARAFGWEAPLSAALARTQAFFGTSVPEAIAAALEEAPPSRATRLVRSREDVSNRRAHEVLSELACLTGRARLKLALAILFPSPRYLKWRYPAAGRLWPFCYPYRFLVILREAVSALAKREREPETFPRSC